MTRSGVGALGLIVALACGQKSNGADTSRAQTDTANRPPAAATPAASAPIAADTKAPPPPRPAPGTSAAPSAAAGGGVDTVRGTIAVVGTDRFKQVIIQPSGSASITLEGPVATLVGRTSGADVWVSGSRSGRTLTVASFAVRTVDGIAATDGQLVAEGDRLVLVSAEGKRQTIANAPPALRQHVGGRVWISGNLAQGPVAFGVIQDKP